MVDWNETCISCWGPMTPAEPFVGYGGETRHTICGSCEEPEDFDLVYDENKNMYVKDTDALYDESYERELDGAEEAADEARMAAEEAEDAEEGR